MTSLSVPTSEFKTVLTSEFESIDRVGQYYIEVEGSDESLYMRVMNSNGVLEIRIKAKFVREGLTEVENSNADSLSNSEFFADTFAESVLSLAITDLVEWIDDLKTPDKRKYELCIWLGINVLANYKDALGKVVLTNSTFEKVMLWSIKKADKLPDEVRDLIL